MDRDKGVPSFLRFLDERIERKGRERRAAGNARSGALLDAEIAELEVVRNEFWNIFIQSRQE
jgi:hypothetical protein